MDAFSFSMLNVEDFKSIGIPLIYIFFSVSGDIIKIFSDDEKPRLSECIRFKFLLSMNSIWGSYSVVWPQSSSFKYYFKYAKKPLKLYLNWKKFHHHSKRENKMKFSSFERARRKRKHKNKKKLWKSFSLAWGYVCRWLRRMWRRMNNAIHFKKNFYQH